MTNKPDWAVGGKDYDALMSLINRIPSDTDPDLVDALAWYFRMLAESDPKTLTAAESNAYVSLFARLSRLGADDPAFSHDDWVDAIIHFPRAVDPALLLSLDDGHLVAVCEALASYKRETYCDQPHGKSLDDVSVMMAAGPAE